MSWTVFAILRRLRGSSSLLAKRYPNVAEKLDALIYVLDQAESRKAERALKRFRSGSYVVSKLGNRLLALAFLQGIDWRRPPRQIYAYLGLQPYRKAPFNFRMKVVALTVSHYLLNDPEYKRLYEERVEHERSKGATSTHAKVRARRWLVKRFIKDVRRQELAKR